MNATVVIQTQVPEDVYRTLQARGIFPEKLSEQVQRLLAMRFYQERILSLGKAARLADMPRTDFIEYLAENDVPVLDFTSDELDVEFAATDRIAEELHL